MTESSLLARLRRALSADRLSPYSPHLPTETQRRFIDLADREALYGGAAGGGKSDALLMAALQYVHVPGYSAMLMRRSHRDLALPEALMDRAHSWLAGTDATWRAGDSEWRFPSGAKLTFGYCQDKDDEIRYQGAAFQFIGIDEVTQWPEKQYRYMFSRLRRLVGHDVPVRMRAATNPGGVGHKWVYQRFVNPKTAIAPFIPAKLGDNPHLDQAEYREMLALLDSTTRDQLQHGLWVVDAAGRVYRYDDERNGVDALPNLGEWRNVLGVDLGASESKPTTAFSHVVWHPHHPAAYIARSWAMAGMTPYSCAEEVRRFIDAVGPCAVVLDEGALGKGYGNEMRTRYQIPVRPAQKRDKLGYRKIMNGDLEQGRLFVVRKDNAPLIEEFESLVWDASGLDVHPSLDDHLSDASLYAWREAKSFTSTAAPEKKPKPYTDEWFAQQEAASLDAERRAWEKEKTDPWETW